MATRTMKPRLISTRDRRAQPERHSRQHQHGRLHDEHHVSAGPGRS
jgi:hypothetical protein